LISDKLLKIEATKVKIRLRSGAVLIDGAINGAIKTEENRVVGQKFNIISLGL
jgi:hypothetical protein